MIANSVPELSPGLIALLGGCISGAMALGFGIGWICKPTGRGGGAPDSREIGISARLKSVEPREPEAPRRGKEKTPSGQRPALGGSRPTATDFESWKGKKALEELRDENTELRNLITLLPGVTRRVTESQERPTIAQVLAEMVTRLCIPPPSKVLVFLSARRGAELVLAAKLGHFGADIFEGMRLEVGPGIIGLAAERRLILDAREYEQQGGSPTSYGFDVDIAAPMSHGDRLHGMIIVAGLPTSARFAKRMVSVAANLGGLALANAGFVAQIRRMADSDGLTGLFNKRYFFEQLERDLKMAERRGEPLSLFMFDLDHFKRYNDLNGHQAGDEALRLTSQLLRERCPEHYTPARYGGEEFIVIMPGVRRAEAKAFAEELRVSVNVADYTHGDTQPMGMVSISGGVASYPQDGKTGSSLVECADARLYKAKNAGRNRVSAS